MDDAVRHERRAARRPGVAARRRLRPVKGAHVHVAIHDPARQPQAALRRWRVENEQDLLAACLPRYEWGTAENGFQHLSVRRAVDAEADSQLALLDVQPKKEHTSATHILRL